MKEKLIRLLDSKDLMELVWVTNLILFLCLIGVIARKLMP